MTTNLRIWALVCGAAILAVLAGGWFVGVQPQLAAAESADSSSAGVAAQNQATRLRLISLSKQAAKSEELKAKRAVLAKAVPDILKPNTFTRRLNEVAALDGVTVDGITFGDATAYTAPPSTTAQADASGGAAPAPELAATDPLISSANFAVVPVTLQLTGTEQAVLQLTHDMQNDERTFTTFGMQTSTGDDPATISATLSGYVYVLRR